MDEETRAAICAAAVRAAKAVDYVGAGTIEFIADASDGLRADRIWFMEMNTRLQVEHPVTEEITGQDLVEWQLRVASGEPLPRTQDELEIHGWAMEARLYAEDPAKGFLPSIGRLEAFDLGDDARVDTGVEQGADISPFYDPMIAKVIAYADTREAAIAKLADALSASQIAGLRTNNAFLIRCLRNPDFVSGNIDTGFIGRHEADLVPPLHISEEVLSAAAGQVLREYAGPSDDPWSTQDSFRLAGFAEQAAEFVVDDKRVAVPYTPTHVDTVRLSNGDIAVMEHGETFTVRPYDPFVAADSAGGASDRVTTPMPGKIIQLLVKPGETVKKGQPLAVLEAMKMEHTLSAPADAKVASVEVSQGDQVNDGAIVVRFETAKAAAE
jgi:3-methylcrotonyl-CoA carboxylase alpha subunit